MSHTAKASSKTSSGSHVNQVAGDDQFAGPPNRPRRCRGTSATIVLIVMPASPFLRRQAERRHLFAVADEQRVADDNGMVPRLAFDGVERRGFLEFVRRRLDEREV